MVMSLEALLKLGGAPLGGELTATVMGMVQTMGLGLLTGFADWF